MAEIKKDWSDGDQVDAADLNSNFSEVGLGRQSEENNAGENLTAKKPVSVADGVEFLARTYASVATTEVIRDTAWFLQLFQTSQQGNKLYSVTARFSGSVGSVTMSNITCKIYAESSGEPSGAVLGSKVGAGTVAQAGAEYEFVFSTPVDLSPSTNYVVVFESTSSSNNDLIARENSAGQGTKKSADSGSSWSNNNGALYIKIKEISADAGEIIGACSQFDNDRFNNFIGFADASATSGNLTRIIVVGLVTGLTGLTAGLPVYLTDTIGGYGHTPGSNSKRIGLALSSTTMLIEHNN